MTYTPMEKSDTFRSPRSLGLICWIRCVLVFLCVYLVVASKVSPPTRKLLLNGSTEVHIRAPQDGEGKSRLSEVTLGEGSVETEILQRELPVMQPKILETHPNSIKERSAPGNSINDRSAPGNSIKERSAPGNSTEERSAPGNSTEERSAPDTCHLLKKIRDDSKNGTSPFSLGVLSDVIIIIQMYPRSASLRYLCANGILSTDLANFSSAESSCSLRNITTVNGNNVTNITISEPSWINYETMDRQGMIWFEMSSKMDSCSKITSNERDKVSYGGGHPINDTNSALQKTIRIIKYHNFTQIRSCCEGLSVVPTTVTTHTTPQGNHHQSTVITTTTATDKGSRTNTAITILIIFIAAVFTVVCLVFLCCKVCCTPKRRPSYKVEYADPSDVIASSSGAEYSTPYDTCKTRNKVVKVTAASRGASGRKPKVSLRKRISQKLGSSRSRRRRRENDSGFSDLLESDGSKMSGRGDQMDAKEGQYMEIPLVNVPVLKTVSNASYTLVEGKQNGHKIALPIQELKEKQKMSNIFSREKSDDPYESLPDNDKNNHACDATTSVLDKNAAENPYAVPDCDDYKKYPSQAQEMGILPNNPYAQIKHVPEETGGATVKRFIKGQEENHYM
ncbi:uncharacterized protein LOC125648176 isoform X4 [Ostrea edulis]|uniref:uncharacterized protein LOC125648176 isoform X4 n=1 Tax=Ostrea edulis TaxID=37623 RepID=UPI0024AF9240|nr:uncharacterized protein LOC125648176 isoform X4 [Ostrea edulis]